MGARRDERFDSDLRIRLDRGDGRMRNVSASGVYFVTDGEPVVFREFVGELMRTQGVEPPTRTLPLGVAKAAAAATEGLWKLARRSSRPPLTRFTVWVSALECTIDDSRARSELGYREVKTREQGLAELRGADAEAPPA